MLSADLRKLLIAQIGNELSAQAEALLDSYE
jgi:hypothetical protein